MVDIFVIIIFVLMIGIGLYRGFLKEILGLFGLISSIALSVLCNKWIVDNVINYNNDPFLSSVIAYIISFLFFSILFSLFINLVLRFMSSEKCSIGDKFFGGVIGFIKAYLICLLFYFIVYGFNSTLKPELSEYDNIREVETITPDWLKNSKTYPFFYKSVLKLDEMLRNLMGEHEISHQNENVHGEKAHENKEKSEIESDVVVDGMDNGTGSLNKNSNNELSNEAKNSGNIAESTNNSEGKNKKEDMNGNSLVKRNETPGNTSNSGSSNNLSNKSGMSNKMNDSEDKDNNRSEDIDESDTNESRIKIES